MSIPGAIIIALWEVKTGRVPVVMGAFLRGKE
jgi:hypothetical protein